ncbi:MAG: chemotaxis protein MotB [Patiriisocius sp.]|jgi:chemotaxis protein MotB
MKNLLLYSAALMLVLSSCVSKKQFTEVEGKYNTCQEELSVTTVSLQKCQLDQAKRDGRVIALEEQLALIKQQNESLKQQNSQSMQQVENLTVLTQSASDNIKSVITQLSEKDKYINGIRGAMTKKDSINLALAFHLKKELQAGIQDDDIQIEVEKTVVYISLSDNLLFASGGSTVLPRAKEILGKVATVVESRPGMEVMVEGHTDSDAISTDCVKDNWDLSVKRSTAVLRVLQDDYNVDPSRLIASGRSQYVPLEPNETVEGKARNRRTRIVILPKLEEFFDILEQKPE